MRCGAGRTAESLAAPVIYSVPAEASSTAFNKDAVMPTAPFTTAMPLAWRCIWQLPAGRKLHGRAYRPRPQEQRHPTRAAAEAHRADLKQRYGAGVICC